MLTVGFPLWNPTSACPAGWVTGDIGQTQAPSTGPDPGHTKLTAGSPKAEWELSTDLRKVQLLSFPGPASSPSPSFFFNLQRIK